jgi:hypothetical protein
MGTTATPYFSENAYKLLLHDKLQNSFLKDISTVEFLQLSSHTNVAIKAL